MTRVYQPLVFIPISSPPGGVAPPAFGPVVERHGN